MLQPHSTRRHATTHRTRIARVHPSRFASFFRPVITTFLLSLLLLTTLLGNWAFPLSYAFAAGSPHPQTIPGNLTFQKYLQQSASVAQRKGHFVRPSTTPRLPLAPNEHLTGNTQLLPSAEPPSMKPISQVLDPTFLTGGASVKPLDLLGSDHRLEVLVQPGSLDFSQAATSAALLHKGR